MLYFNYPPRNFGVSINKIIMFQLPKPPDEIQALGQKLIFSYKQYQTDKLINAIFMLCALCGILTGIIHVNYYEIGAAGFLMLITGAVGWFNHLRRGQPEIALGKILFLAQQQTKKLSVERIKELHHGYWRTQIRPAAQ